MQRTECDCTHPGCGASYPVRRQVPVLINESNSLFSIAGVLAGSEKAFPEEQKPLRQILSAMAPTLSSNLVGRENYEAFARAVLELSAPARVLVIGSRVSGSGMEVLADRDDIELV